MNSTLRATMTLVAALSMPGCSTAASLPEPGDSAEEAPEMETRAGEHGLLHEPPSANYRVERRTMSDTCSPAQTATASTTLGVVSRFRKDDTIASVPVVLSPRGAAMARMDLVLGPGKTIETSHSPCKGATITLRATVTEVEADSFTVRVERDYQGVEACVDARPNTPASSCSAVEELRFDVETALCPARCSFQPRVDSSGKLAGECNCGRQSNPD